MLWLVVVAVWLACLAGGLAFALWSEAAPERRRRGGRLLFRAYPLVLVTGLALVPLVTVARVEDGGGGRTVTPMVVQALLLTVVVAAVGAGLFLLGANLSGHDPTGGEIARRLTGDELSQRLLARWLQRVRWRRWLGGFLGVVGGLITLADGISGYVLLTGLAGAMAGSVSAELHHWRPAGREARAADLSQRRLADYTDRTDQVLLAAVAGAAVAAIVVDGLRQPGREGTLWAGLALAVMAGVVVMQWRIVARRRPALPAELRQADDLMRRLAVSRGVARPGLALGLGLVAQAFSVVGIDLVGAVLWLAAVVMWWLGRRLGLDHLLRRPVAVA